MLNELKMLDDEFARAISGGIERATPDTRFVETSATDVRANDVITELEEGRNIRCVEVVMMKVE
jgi:hypothetical protein